MDRLENNRIIWTFHLVFIANLFFCQDSVQITVNATLDNQNIELNQPLRFSDDSHLEISTLKFYLSNFKSSYESGEHLEPNSYYLIDFEDQSSRNLSISNTIPDNEKFSLEFTFGIDSATHQLGAMEGDLDPTKRMYWTWQSGYINFKLEGDLITNGIKQEITLHLGGYTKPFTSFQSVRSGALIKTISELSINLELLDLVKIAKEEGKSTIMSPSADSRIMSKVLAKSFYFK